MLKAFPSSLTDEQFEQVKAIAKADVPPLPAIGPKAMAEALTMLDSSLPRRATDTASGELRLRAYRQCLSHLRAEQMWWTVQQAIKECRFFPTVKELLDIAEGWERRDEATEAHRLAKLLTNREVNRRLREQSRKPAPPLTQELVDGMAPELKKMGLKLGYLIEVDGQVVPAPEQEDAA